MQTRTRTRTCGATLGACHTKNTDSRPCHASRATRAMTSSAWEVSRETAGTGRAGRSLGRGWLGPEAVSASLVSSLKSQHLDSQVSTQAQRPCHSRRCAPSTPPTVPQRPLVVSTYIGLQALAPVLHFARGRRQRPDVVPTTSMAEMACPFPPRTAFRADPLPRGLSNDLLPSF